MKFQDIKKSVAKMKKQKKNNMLPPDEAKILDLAEARINEIQKLEDIDKQLVLIQRSTKTTFSKLAPLHNFCRMKWQWYYKWSMNPVAGKIHTSMLTLYILAVFCGLSFGILGGNHPITYAAATDCNWTDTDADNDWHNPNNWDCGHVPTNNDNAILSTSYSDDDVNIDSTATAASFSMVDYYGTVNANENISIDNTNGGNGAFATGANGVFNLAAGKTLTISGSFTLSSAPFTAGDGSTVDLTGTGNMSIATSGQAFYNLTVAHTGKTTTLANSNTINVNGRLTLSGDNTGAFNSGGTSTVKLLENSDTPIASNGAVLGTNMQINFLGTSQNIPAGNFYNNATLVINGNATYKLLGDITCYYLTVAYTTGGAGRSTLDTAGYNITITGIGTTGLTVGSTGTTAKAGTIINSTGLTDSKITTVNLRIARGTSAAEGTGILDATVNGNGKTINIDLTGNWTNADTFTAGSSTVTFKGSVSQQIITNIATAVVVNNAYNNLIYATTGDNANTLSTSQAIGAPALDVNGLLTITKGTLSPGVCTNTLKGGLTFSDTTNGAFARTADDILTLNGGTWTDNRSTKQSLGTVYISGTNTTTTLGSSVKADKILISGGDTLSLGTNNYTLELAGTGAIQDVITNTGTFSPGTSTVKYSATNSGGNVNVAAVPYSSLQLSGSETYDLTASMTGANTITGNLTIDAGAALSATSSNYNLSVAGNWTNNGTFDPTAGTVTLSGPDSSTQIVTGDSTFYNLVITTFANTAGRAVHFEPSSVQTISNAITLSGAEGKILELALNGGVHNVDHWTFSLPGDYNPSGDYISVSDCSTIGGFKIYPGSNVTDGGNNSGWAFALPPNAPTNLKQYIDGTETEIATGGWTKSTSVKFTASVSDPNNPDLLILCIEIQPISNSFGNDFSCNAVMVDYSGEPVLADYTIDNIEPGQYHWQARVKDDYGSDSQPTQYASGEFAFGIDTQAPTISASANPAPDGGYNSWYKSQPTITLTADDGEGNSGVASISYRWGASGDFTTVNGSSVEIVDSHENGNDLYYYATDNAGNDSSHSAKTTYSLDTTAPSASISIDPSSPNGDDSYYKGSAPTLTLSGNDGTGSGVGSIYYRWGASGDYTLYSSAITAPEGINTLYVYAIDNVANSGSGSPTTQQIKVDTNTPTVTVASNPGSPNGSNNYYIGAAPTITLSANDGTGSGVSNIQYKWDSGSYAAYTTALTPAEGTHTLHFYAVDNAGNSGLSSADSVTYNVETDPQTVTLTSNPVAPNGSNGYYKTSAPSITLSATNSNSGISAIKYHWGSDSDTTYTTPFNAPEGTNTLTYYAVTNAGNSSPAETQTFKVDITNPSVSIHASPAEPAGNNNYYLTSPEITFTASDTSGSGVDHIYYHWDSGVDSTYSSTINTPEGHHVIYYYVIDTAGNSSQNLQQDYYVDTVHPTADISINPGSPDGSNSYYKSTPAVTITASDTGGSGIASISYRNSTSGSFTTENGSSFEVPLTDGDPSALYYYTTDNAGNQSTTLNHTYLVDTVAPSASIDISPAAPDGSDGYYKTAPSISFLASDATSGDVNFYCWWNSQPSQSCNGPLTALEGTNTLHYYAIDAAGNQTDEQTQNFKVDTSLPTGSISVNANDDYTTANSVTLTISASDDTTNISQMMLSNTSNFNGADWEAYSGDPRAWAIADSEGEQNVYIKFKDSAGNQSQTYFDSIILDKNAPSITSGPTSQTPTKNTKPQWAWNAASDTASGVAGYYIKVNKVVGEVETEQVAETWLGNQTNWTHETALVQGGYKAYIKARDNAGNTGTYSAGSTIVIDTTAPTGSVTLATDSTNGYITTTNTSFSLASTDTGGSQTIKMAFSEDNVNYSSYEDFAATKNYSISSGDGTKKLYVKFKDTAGNESQAYSTADFLLDTTGPGSFSLYSPAENTWKNTTAVTFVWESAVESISGITKYQLFIDDQLAKDDISKTTTNYTVENLAAGSHTWKVIAVDGTGRERVAAKRTFGIDTEQPGIVDGIIATNLTNPAKRLTNQRELKLAWKQTTDNGDAGIDAYLVTISSGTKTIATDQAATGTAFTKLLDNDGVYEIIIKAKDKAGNISVASSQYQFSLDTVKPTTISTAKTIDVSNRISGNYGAYLYWTASTDTQGLNSYKITKDGQTIATIPYLSPNGESPRYYVQYDLTPGRYVYTVTATDDAGNISAASPEAIADLPKKEDLTGQITNIEAKPSAVVNSETNKTSALITWKTEALATSVVELEGKNYGEENISQLNMGHSVLIPNLTANTSYHYKVVSKDIYGNEMKSADMIFRTNPAVKKQSAVEVIIKSLQEIFSVFEKTSAAALQRVGFIKPEQVAKDGVIAINISDPALDQYGTFIALAKNNMNLERTTDGKNYTNLGTIAQNYYVDINQSKSLKYTYRIKNSTDTASIIPDATDTKAPTITDLQILNDATIVTEDKAQIAITWKTDKPAQSTVKYGTGISLTQTATDPNYNMEHLVVLTDLEPGKTYKYTAGSRAENEQEATSEIQTFTTPSQKTADSILQVIVRNLQEVLAKFNSWLRK